MVSADIDTARWCSTSDVGWYLNQTQQIAERGPMPLFLVDVHLHRARMFRDKGELAKAAQLIRELGYGRRYDELTDAEDAAKGWSW